MKMKMKKHLWGTYGTWVLFTEAVGGLAGWLILFALMGIGAARVYLAPPSGLRSRSLLLFLVQLAFNFFWSIYC